MTAAPEKRSARVLRLELLPAQPGRPRRAVLDCLHPAVVPNLSRTTVGLACRQGELLLGPDDVLHTAVREDDDEAGADDGELELSVRKRSRRYAADLGDANVVMHVRQTADLPEAAMLMSCMRVVQSPHHRAAGGLLPRWLRKALGVKRWPTAGADAAAG